MNAGRSEIVILNLRPNIESLTAPRRQSPTLRDFVKSFYLFTSTHWSLSFTLVKYCMKNIIYVVCSIEMYQNTSIEVK
jgi:hypothetical protein